MPISTVHIGADVAKDSIELFAEDLPLPSSIPPPLSGFAFCSRRSKNPANPFTLPESQRREEEGTCRGEGTPARH